VEKDKSYQIARPFYFSILMLCFSVTAFGAKSNCSIKGFVLDEDTRNPLINANVFIENRGDSIVYIVTSDNTGWFHISGLKMGKYNIEISYIGYKKYRKSIRLDSKMIDLGMIYLKPEAVPLESVEIVARLPMAIQNGDTVVYNAKAIALSQHASAKDLVLKMMGFYENDGQLQIDGENIEKALVNGDEFFNFGPSLTLETIPADMIDKIQVYNKRSEEAEFLNIDDGNTKKAINIILKKDKKNGQFGKCLSAYGQHDVYQLGANINSLKRKRQFAMNAQTNNNLGANSNTFGSDDNSWASRALNTLSYSREGFSNNRSGNVSFNNTYKKVKINIGYSYSQSDIENRNSIYRKFLTDTDSDHEYTNNDENNKNQLNHRLFSTINYNITDRDEIRFYSSTLLSKTNQQTVSRSRTLIDSTSVILTNIQKNDALSRHSFMGNLSYKHDFIKGKRFISISISGDDNKNRNEYSQRLENNALVDTIHTNYHTKHNNSNHYIEGNVFFQENLERLGKVSVKTAVTRNKDNSLKNTYHFSDTENRYSEFDSSLSGNSDYDLTTNSFSMFYDNTINRFKIWCHFIYENSILTNTQRIPANYNNEYSYHNWLPFIRTEYKFNKTNILRFDYDVNSRIPRSDQLVEILDDDNPENLRIGNAGLNQQLNHSLNFVYRSRNTKENKSLTIRNVIRYSNSYIASRTIIAGADAIHYDGIEILPGAQLTRPENMTGYLSTYFFITRGFPIKFIKSNMSISVNAGYDEIPGYLENSKYFIKRISSGMNIVINSNISKNISYRITNNLYISKTAYSEALRDNKLQFNLRSRAKLEWNFGPGYVFNTDLNYINYNRVSTTFNNTSLLWNVSFGKRLFKNQQGDLRLYIYDLLKDNNNINQHYTETYIEERESLDLDRYLMLIFTYNIKHFPDHRK